MLVINNGKTLKDYRIELGFSQEELAVLAGMSCSSVRNLEQFRSIMNLTWSNAYHLAKAIGIRSMEEFDDLVYNQNAMYLEKNKEK